MDIALVAPPWPLFNRPSIQLGVLKAFLAKNLPKGYSVKNLHPYINVARAVGFSNYHLISQSSWASEAVFAEMLFPGRDGPRRLFKEALRARSRRKIKLDFDKLSQKASRCLEGYLAKSDFSSSRLVGISVCLNQLAAGLYTAKCIKKRFPDLKIVLGGASVSGPIGQGVLRAFPFVDYVINGEGELPLLSLSRYVLGISEKLDSRAVLTRDKPQRERAKEQIADLDTLPAPDFDDFFRELSGIKGASGINVVLPVEASRGCWWGRCTFCNLNLQWKGYRSKSSQKVAAEVDYLCKRYSSVDFAFMDNCLPRREAAAIFDEISRHKRDYSFFAEIRAGHLKKDLARMKKGGLDTVQVGIEALSTSLLRRLKKGATVILNLAAMKNCAELGIELQANLITCFPGSTEEEARQTLENLEFSWPFFPLKPVRFWLGAESPVFQDFKSFNIRYIKPHPRYFLLFPKEVSKSFSPLIYEHMGEKKRLEKIWKPVEKRLVFLSQRRKALGIKGPAMTFRDGGHFLIIRQVLPDGRVLTHRLSGASRKIYLAAQEPVSVDRLFSIAPDIPNEKIEGFLMQMHDKRLIFLEDGLALALACRKRKAF